MFAYHIDRETCQTRLSFEILDYLLLTLSLHMKAHSGASASFRYSIFTEQCRFNALAECALLLYVYAC